jgi:hypothetical protein
VEAVAEESPYDMTVGSQPCKMRKLAENVIKNRKKKRERECGEKGVRWGWCK